MHFASLLHTQAEPTAHDPALTKRVLLRAGQVPNLMQFADVSIPPGESVETHRHWDMSEVFLVVSGQGIFTVGASARVLGPGDCVAVTPGDPHSLHNNGREPWVLVYFGVLAAR